MFFLDLTKKNLELLEFEREDLDEDLKDLHSTADYKVFNSLDEAESYKERYERVLAGLDNSKICQSRELPAMLLKRRYIVQALMGEKNQTIRSYKKDWTPGQIFNLHDQKYFLTVILKRIEKLDSGNYSYQFEILK